MASTSVAGRRPMRGSGARLPALIAINAAAFAAVAMVVAAGVWVAGGVVTDDYRTSMGLTAAWFVISAGAAFAIARRRRSVRAGVWAGYVLTAAAIATYLGLATLRDRVVDERVVTGVPVAQATRGEAARPRPVEVARGRFVSHEHTTSGVAAVVRLPDGRRFLTLTGFDTSAGPDLRVRLVPGAGHDGGVDGAVDLGALKGNRGDQQYALPEDARVGASTVVIWCRAFSAPFGSAPLRT
jgi:hypothetical protein